MKKRLLFLFALGMGFGAHAQLTGGTVYRINGTDGGSGATRTFESLRSAATYVNVNGLTGTGQAVLEFTAPYTNETIGATSITFNALPGASATLGLTIRPATGMNVSLTANLTALPLIDLNNADYITIDGRPGGVGTTKSLTLENTSTSSSAQTSVVRMINDAQFNKLSYLNFKIAAAVNTVSASVLLSTSAAGTTGNTNNTIDNNTFSSASTAVAGAAPTPQIASSGTASLPNHNTQITNNNFEYWGGRAAIYSVSGNAWQINNNHFYSTQTVVADGTNATGIVYLATSLGGHTINNNFIGGQTANAGGAAMNMTAQSTNFISVNATSSAAKTTIQGNTFANINANTPTTGASNFRVILTAGSQIVDVLNNTIGSLSTPNSFVINKNTNGSASYFLIQPDNTGDNASNIKDNILANVKFNELGGVGTNSFYGIYVNAGNGKLIDNNTITKISASGALTTYALIYTAVDTEITNNKIGSQSTTGDISLESIIASSNYNGIYAFGNFATKITGNQIGGLSIKTTLATAATSTFYVIRTVGSSTLNLKPIENNIIGGTVASSIQTIVGGGAAAAKINIYGIYMQAAISRNNTVRHFSANEEGVLYGIYALGSFANTVENNIIEVLTLGGVSNGSYLSGIFDGGSAATAITGNTIWGLRSRNVEPLTSATSPYKNLMGIFGSGGNSILSGNRIYDLENTGVGAATVYGIVGKFANILKNRIYNLKITSATSGASVGGMALAETSPNAYNVSNNVIHINHDGIIPVYGILAEYDNATDPAAAINASYNTILLEGTATHTAGSSAIYRDGDSPMDLKNNLLFNNRSGGTGAHSLYATTNGAAAWSSNYNFLATASGNPIVGYWSGVNQDFTSWKASHSGQDVNSINDMTLTPSAFFNMASASTQFLKTTEPGKLKVAGKGTSVSVTDDILGTSRATLPTMGAFEEVVVLPVTFSGFTAKLNGNKVNLNWSVSSEVEILRYEIERLTNSGTFVKVATVSAGQLNSYSAVDANPKLGSNYYRLSAINNDGTASYFEGVREVKVASLNEGAASVYPNPLVGNTVNVAMAAYSNGTYTYKLSDITGRLLQKGSFDHKGGSNTITVSAAMPKGVYVLQISNGKEQIQAKLIKP
ncbi:T9SS type A sorting domain-containing protein [Pedobacter xixiisoli]|uniref:Por secretion system C-terminal sorting domain-containing protein n=1 Tax=Pedobacter xixiisoli TaxID=1476464 RepID=A0A285ZUL6_9SPHI|nr:T9SS type A sorting domain-containing protein [Pedobacter xixiisoli]SOD13318.1 Por secretion system C-terminal sorting domain-containing protein [Pedobacter xixiisoli]